MYSLDTTVKYKIIYLINLNYAKAYIVCSLPYDRFNTPFTPQYMHLYNASWYVIMLYTYYICV